MKIDPYSCPLLAKAVLGSDVICSCIHVVRSILDKGHRFSKKTIEILKSVLRNFISSQIISRKLPPHAGSESGLRLGPFHTNHLPGDCSTSAEDGPSAAARMNRYSGPLASSTGNLNRNVATVTDTDTASLSGIASGEKLAGTGRPAPDGGAWFSRPTRIQLGSGSVVTSDGEFPGLSPSRPGPGPGVRLEVIRI
jgi:hypothetical protein